MTALLQVQGLTKSFQGRVLFRNLALQLDAGERLAISGASGCGKTTLLRILAGLETADEGEITLKQQIATRHGQPLLPPWRRGMQMVFQDLGLWPARSVRQNVLDALRARGVARNQASVRCQQLLAELDLASHAEQRPDRLSGGEGRRLALARALAMEPEILLLDEPFTSLDPDRRTEGFTLLDRILERTGAAVILVSHDATEAQRLGGRSAVLVDGGLQS